MLAVQYKMRALLNRIAVQAEDSAGCKNRNAAFLYPL